MEYSIAKKDDPGLQRVLPEIRRVVVSYNLGTRIKPLENRQAPHRRWQRYSRLVWDREVGWRSTKYGQGHRSNSKIADRRRLATSSAHLRF